MFLKGFFIAAALINFVAASPAPGPSCSKGGTPYCCDDSDFATSSLVSGLLRTLGVVLGDTTGLVGLGCKPPGSDGCGTKQPLCCTGGSSSTGILVFGCNPAPVEP